MVAESEERRCCRACGGRVFGSEGDRPVQVWSAQVSAGLRRRYEDGSPSLTIVTIAGEASRTRNVTHLGTWPRRNVMAGRRSDR